LISIQHSEKLYALFAHSFFKVLYEFEDVGSAEFSARFQVGRTSQNCQLFFGQAMVSLLAWHFVF